MRRLNSTPEAKAKEAIRAELIGSGVCVALGMGAASTTPVLKLCRELIARGHHPATPLDTYRGDTLALRIRSVGEAARLELNSEGTGFRRRREPDASPSVADSGRAATGAPGSTERAA